MTLRFARFIPGDELMDEETFFALHSDHAAAPVRRTAESVRSTAGRGSDVTRVSEEVGVPFLYRDFRKGWNQGIQASKQMGLYRQEYCGCLYSERDRFLGPPGKPEHETGADP